MFGAITTMTKKRFLLMLGVVFSLFFMLVFILSGDFAFSVASPFLALTFGVFMGVAYPFDWLLRILYCAGLILSVLMMVTSLSIKSIWNVSLSLFGIALWIVLGFIGLSTGT